MVSPNARRHAGRVLPHFPGPGGRPVMPGGGSGGYSGIQGILAALQGGLSSDQFGNMAAGHTGGHGWGGIGGMHGAMSGLSPYAVNFLSTLMEKKAAQHQALTDESGAALTGDALWKAQLMNNLADQNAAANPTYQLHSGVDADFLGQLFGQGFGGHSAYEKGFGAEGRLGPPAHQIHQFTPHAQQHAQHLQGGGVRRRTRPFRPGGVVRRPLGR